MSNILIEKAAEFLDKNKLAESKTERYHSAEKDKWSTNDLSRYDKGDKVYAHSEALKRPDLTSQNISSILLRNKDSDVRMKALEHPNASERDIKNALDSLHTHGISYHLATHANNLKNHKNAPKEHPVYAKIDSINAEHDKQSEKIRNAPKATELTLGSGREVQKDYDERYKKSRDAWK